MTDPVSHPNADRFLDGAKTKDSAADKEAYKRQPRGCFFYGCFGFVLLSMVACGAVVYGARSAVETLVAKHTEDAPAEGFDTPPNKVETAILLERIDKAKAQGSQISLTPKEIALLANHLSVAEEVRVIEAELLEDTIRLQFSIALVGELVEGRYLNGYYYLKPNDSGGLEPVKIEVRNLEIDLSGASESNFSEIGKEYLGHLYSNDSPYIDGYKAVEISQGKLILQTETDQKKP